jgi:hypothetical protein
MYIQKPRKKEDKAMEANNVVIEKKADTLKSGTIVDEISQIKKNFLWAFKLYSECEEHTIKMKTIVKSHNVHLTEHGTIIAINEMKNLNQIDAIWNDIKDNPEIKEYAKSGIDSLDTNSFEREIERRTYTILMRIYPEYCRQKASDDFVSFMKNQKNLPMIKELFNIHGTLLDTESDIDGIVRKILNK